MPKYLTPASIALLVLGALTLPLPYFSFINLWIYVILSIPYILFTIYLDITGKVQNEKLKAYCGYYGLLLICIYFGTPAIKQFHDQPIFQVSMIMVWVFIFAISGKSKDTLIKITLPSGEDNKYKFFSALYYGFIVLVVLAGGGGHYKGAEYFSRIFGHKATMYYFTILLLLCAYWFTIFTQSTTTRFKEFKK